MEFEDAIRMCRMYGFAVEKAEGGWILSPKLSVYLSDYELIQFIKGDI